MSTQRADTLIHQLGLTTSRTLAQHLIRAGKVEILNRGHWLPVERPGQQFETNAHFRILNAEELRYVSRGGLKLAGALARTGMSVEGRCILDVGQSTGGFSDCLLQAGAGRVVGIDTGHSQLSPALLQHPRITCLEGINARHLPQGFPPQQLPGGGFERIVIDVSFISQTLILAPVLTLAAPCLEILALVKPQFEAGRENIGKGGLVRNVHLYGQVRDGITALYQANGLEVRDYFESSISGGDGNREFFIYASRGGG